MRQVEKMANPKILLSIAIAGIFLASGLVSFPGLESKAFSVISAAPARITVHPNPASPGSAVKIVGYNFPISQTITLRFDKTIIGSPVAGSNGQFSFQYTLPLLTADGTHTIQATDTLGDDLSTTLTVVAGITVTPVRAIDGGSVVISGTGFSHSSKTTISFDSKSISKLTTSSTGTFSLTYNIPLTTLAGVHIFSAVDSGGHSASKGFTTISKIVLSRTSGSAGAAVKVKGSGFGASLPLTLTFNGASIPGQPPLTTNSTGGFSLSFTVPSYSPATYTVKATDSQGDTSSAQFTIV